MAIQFDEQNKVVKTHTTKKGKGCTATLVLQIILTVGLGALAFAPFLTFFFGVTLFFVFGIGVFITTAGTLGLIWLSDGYKSFQARVWTFIQNCFSKPEEIRDALRGSIIWVSILILVASSVGFIYNIIYFMKHDKVNKGRFITSCVFLGLGIFYFIMAIIMYLPK